MSRLFTPSRVMPDSWPFTLRMTFSNGLSLISDGEAELTATKSMRIEGQGVDMTAQQAVKIKGQNAEVAGQMGVKIQGMTAEMSGQTSAKIKALKVDIN